MAIESPPPTTACALVPISGNGYTSKPVLGFNVVLDATTPGTKSPSITCAAFGLVAKTLDTEVGKSVSSAPEVPPAMLPVSLKTCDIACSLPLTDGSVHFRACVDSLSYLSGPAWRR